MRCLNENALKRVEIMRLFRANDSTNSPPFFCFQRKALWESLGACGLMGVYFSSSHKQARRDANYDQTNDIIGSIHEVRSEDFQRRSQYNVKLF